MQKPILRIQTTPLGWLLEIVSMVGLALMFYLVLSNYASLPEVLPQHYTAAGEPDRVGSKSIIWLMPALAVVLYALITFLSRFPHVFNYPYTITASNAAAQYSNALMMVRTVKTIVIFQFLYITYMKIQIGVGTATGLGAYFLPVTIVILIGTILFFVIRGFKLQ